MSKEIATSPGHQSDDSNYQEPPYEIESNAYKHAKRELEILCQMYPTKDNPPIIRGFIHEILALVDKFGHSGQSGGSAPMVAQSIANAVNKLCTFQIICPITGFDSEWVDVMEYAASGDKVKYQNKRLSSIFKDTDGKAWYLDAIVWKNQHGTTWTGNATMVNGKSINCKQYIKSFPFEPKTFVIDVIEKEVAKDDWEFTLKNDDQLKEVFEYYDFYTV